MGGKFTQTGDTSPLTDLGNIARYDTTGETWYRLPKEGLDDWVHALAVDGSDLYVGGRFTQTGDVSPLTNLGNIARYDTDGKTWNAPPNGGLDDEVYALAVSGSGLYVGGKFTQTGDLTTLTNLGNIVRYDTTTTPPSWSKLLNDGLDNWVYALAVSGSDLYVGGEFINTGTWTTLNHIARYNTTTPAWHALENDGLNDEVYALAVSGSDLYVAGGFTQTGDLTTLTNLGFIARYDTDGKTWNELPNGGFDNWVHALAVSDSDLYVGGVSSKPATRCLTWFASPAAPWPCPKSRSLTGPPALPTARALSTSAPPQWGPLLIKPSPSAIQAPSS